MHLIMKNKLIVCLVAFYTVFFIDVLTLRWPTLMVGGVSIPSFQGHWDTRTCFSTVPRVPFWELGEPACFFLPRSHDLIARGQGRTAISRPNETLEFGR